MARKKLARSFAFIGAMGAGKSLIANLLVRKLQASNHKVCTIDLDAEIERKSRLKIREIFANSGEKHFRKLESETLRETLTKFECTGGDKILLLACGGGVALAAENKRLLGKLDERIYLDINAQTMRERTELCAERPLLCNDFSYEEHLRERAKHYEQCATFVIKVNSKSPEEIVEAIFNKFFK